MCYLPPKRPFCFVLGYHHLAGASNIQHRSKTAIPVPIDHDDLSAPFHADCQGSFSVELGQQQASATLEGGRNLKFWKLHLSLSLVLYCILTCIQNITAIVP
jgi:hypothetical protein